MAKQIVPDANNDGSNLGLDNQRWSGANLQTLNVGGNKIAAPFVRYVPNATHRGGNVGDTTGFGQTPTIGEPINSLFAFTEASTGQLLFFRLVAGSADEGKSDTEIPPGDYNQNTNRVFFKFVQPFLPFNTSTFHPEIGGQVGSTSEYLSAIVSPEDGQLVEYLDGNNSFLRYIFQGSATDATNDPIIVRDNGNTGAWKLLSLFDRDGESYDVQATVLPGGLFANYLTLQNPLNQGTIINGIGLQISLGGGRFGAITFANTLLSATQALNFRVIVYHSMSSSLTQSLPSISTVGDGSHVLIGYEIDFLNDDATHTLTINVNGGSVVLQPGDRIYLRAIGPAGQFGYASDTWDYRVFTAIGKSLTGASSTVNARAAIGAAPSLSITTPKSAAYTAAANEYVTVDCTVAPQTITLPAAPLNGTIVGVKIVATAPNTTGQPGTNVCNVVTSGSDVFTKTGGATSETVRLLNEGMMMEYKTAGAIWTIISNDLPVASLDLRYPPIAALPNKFSFQNLGWGTSEVLNFAAQASFVWIQVGGATTFSTSNITAGAALTIKLSAAATQTLAFPSSWVWLGGTAPTQILAGKVAMLSLSAFGSTDADIVAAYAAQP